MPRPDGYDRLMADLRASMMGLGGRLAELAREARLAEVRAMELIDEHGFPVQRAPDGASDDDFRHGYRRYLS